MQAAVLKAFDQPDASGVNLNSELADRLRYIAPCISAQLEAAADLESGSGNPHSSRLLVPPEVHIMGCASNHIFTKPIADLTVSEVRQLRRGNRANPSPSLSPPPPPPPPLPIIEHDQVRAIVHLEFESKLTADASPVSLCNDDGIICAPIEYKYIVVEVPTFFAEPDYDSAVFDNSGIEWASRMTSVEGSLVSLVAETLDTTSGGLNLAEPACNNWNLFWWGHFATFLLDKVVVTNVQASLEAHEAQEACRVNKLTSLEAQHANLDIIEAEEDTSTPLGLSFNMALDAHACKHIQGNTSEHIDFTCFVFDVTETFNPVHM